MPPAVPSHLNIYLQCKEWGVLPYVGGFMEQPYLFWLYMMAAADGYQTKLDEQEKLRQWFEQQKQKEQHGKGNPAQRG